MKKIIISLFLIVFLLTGCNNKENDKILQDYPNINDEHHVYKVATYHEVIDLLTNKTGVVIFGFSTCPYCQAVMPLLNQSAKEVNYRRILYFDIYEMRKDKTDEYLNLVEIITKQVDDLAYDEEGTPRIVVPDVYFVKDGTIVAHHIATSKDENGNWIRNLSNDQQEELKTIYKSYFQLITNEK